MNHFIHIPGSEGYTNADGITSKKGWLVMTGQATFADDSDKEAFFGGSRYDTAPKDSLITCRPGNRPINMITADEALHSAQNLLVDEKGKKLKDGSLLDIGLWQLLVKDIVSVEENWHGGRLAGKLYYGNSFGDGALTLPRNHQKSNGYDGVDKNDSYQRRYFVLSNGQKIWDLSGNLWEYFRERHDRESSSGLHICSSEAVIGENLEDRNGGRPYGVNIGKESVGVDKQYAALLGGSWGTTTYAGVFNSNWNAFCPSSARYYSRGIRCVVPRN